MNEAIHPTARALQLGRLLVPLNPNGERDDTAAHGETNAYKDGATIVLQMYDAEAVAWRSVTLS